MIHWTKAGVVIIFYFIFFDDVKTSLRHYAIFRKSHYSELKSKLNNLIALMFWSNDHRSKYSSLVISIIFQVYLSIFYPHSLLFVTLAQPYKEISMQNYAQTYSISFHKVNHASYSVLFHINTNLSRCI